MKPVIIYLSVLGTALVIAATASILQQDLPKAVVFSVLATAVHAGSIACLFHAVKE